MSEEVQSSPTPRRRARKSTGDVTAASEPSSASSDRRSVERNSSGLRRSFVDALGWIITGAWGFSFALDMSNLIPEYSVPPELYGLMTIVAGAAFVGSVIRKDANASE